MGEWNKTSPVGKWGEWFFKRFRTIHTWQQQGQANRLIEMDYNGKSGAGYAGKYGKAGQEAGIDFLEIRDGGQYAYAYEVKTDVGALFTRLPRTYQREADITRIINEDFRPFEGVSKDTAVKKCEKKMGWGNLFVETVQNIDTKSDGWYPIIKRNAGKLDEVFPEGTFPPIRGRDIVEILVRQFAEENAHAYLLFIPDTTFIQIVEDAVKRLGLVETNGGQKAEGYKVPIPEFFDRPYDEAFLKPDGGEELDPEKDPVLAGPWRDGISIYPMPLDYEELTRFKKAVNGKFDEP